MESELWFGASLLGELTVSHPPLGLVGAPTARIASTSAVVQQQNVTSIKHSGHTSRFVVRGDCIRVVLVTQKQVLNSIVAILYD